MKQILVPNSNTFDRSGKFLYNGKFLTKIVPGEWEVIWRGSRAHHLATNSHIVDHRPDLAFVLRVHDNHEIRRVLQQEVRADDSLSHERHKMALFARIYIYHPINASAGGPPQQVQEHDTFGARAPDHDLPAVGS